MAQVMHSQSLTSHLLGQDHQIREFKMAWGRGNPDRAEQDGINAANAGRPATPPAPRPTMSLTDRRSEETALAEHNRYLDGYNRTSEAKQHSERLEKK
jgi:hypothetical protein